MRTDVGAIEQNGFEVCILGEQGKDILPNRELGPGVESFVYGLPGAEFGGQIAPWGTGAQDPQDAIEHEAGIFCGPAPRVFAGQADQGFETLPKRVGNVVAAHAAIVP